MCITSAQIDFFLPNAMIIGQRWSCTLLRMPPWWGKWLATPTAHPTGEGQATHPSFSPTKATSFQDNQLQFPPNSQKGRAHRFQRCAHNTALRSVKHRILWRRGRPILGVGGAPAGDDGRRPRPPPPPGPRRPRHERACYCPRHWAAACSWWGNWVQQALLGEMEVQGSAARVAAQLRAGA